MVDVNSTEDEIREYAKDIVNDVKENGDWSEPYEDENGEMIQSCFIGTVMALAPSGKYYMPWCTNQTEDDEDKDSIFYNALEEYASDAGFFTFNGDGDPCDMFIGKFTEDSEE